MTSSLTLSAQDQLDAAKAFVVASMGVMKKAGVLVPQLTNFLVHRGVFLLLDTVDSVVQRVYMWRSRDLAELATPAGWLVLYTQPAVCAAVKYPGVEPQQPDVPEDERYMHPPPSVRLVPWDDVGVQAVLPQRLTDEAAEAAEAAAAHAQAAANAIVIDDDDDDAPADQGPDQPQGGADMAAGEDVVMAEPRRGRASRSSDGSCRTGESRAVRAARAPAVGHSSGGGEQQLVVAAQRQLDAGEVALDIAERCKQAMVEYNATKLVEEMELAEKCAKDVTAFPHELLEKAVHVEDVFVRELMDGRDATTAQIRAVMQTVALLAHDKAELTNQTNMALQAQREIAYELWQSRNRQAALSGALEQSQQTVQHLNGGVGLQEHHARLEDVNWRLRRTVGELRDRAQGLAGMPQALRSLRGATSQVHAQLRDVQAATRVVEEETCLESDRLEEVMKAMGVSLDD